MLEDLRVQVVPERVYPLLREKPHADLLFHFPQLAVQDVLEPVGFQEVVSR